MHDELTERLLRFVEQHGMAKLLDSVVTVSRLTDSGSFKRTIALVKIADTQAYIEGK